MKRLLSLGAFVAALGSLGLFALVVLLTLILRPHLYLWDQARLVSLESQLAAQAPRAQQTWSERHQTGSCCAYLYGLALLPPADPPAGVHVYRLVDGAVIEDQGLYEGQIYEPDCFSCAPHSIASALQAHPGMVVWARYEDAAWFD